MRPLGSHLDEGVRALALMLNVVSRLLFLHELHLVNWAVEFIGNVFPFDSGCLTNQLEGLLSLRRSEVRKHPTPYMDRLPHVEQFAPGLNIW